MHDKTKSDAANTTYPGIIRRLKTKHGLEDEICRAIAKEILNEEHFKENVHPNLRQFLNIIGLE